MENDFPRCFEHFVKNDLGVVDFSLRGWRRFSSVGYAHPIFSIKKIPPSASECSLPESGLRRLGSRGSPQIGNLLRGPV